MWEKHIRLWSNSSCIPFPQFFFSDFQMFRKNQSHINQSPTNKVSWLKKSYQLDALLSSICLWSEWACICLCECVYVSSAVREGYLHIHSVVCLLYLHTSARCCVCVTKVSPRRVCVCVLEAVGEQGGARKTLMWLPVPYFNTWWWGHWVPHISKTVWEPPVWVPVCVHVRMCVCAVGQYVLMWPYWSLCICVSWHGNICCRYENQLPFSSPMVNHNPYQSLLECILLSLYACRVLLPRRCASLVFFIMRISLSSSYITQLQSCQSVHIWIHWIKAWSNHYFPYINVL